MTLGYIIITAALVLLVYFARLIGKQSDTLKAASAEIEALNVEARKYLGDLTALASDPSIGNAVKDIVANRQKVQP